MKLTRGGAFAVFLLTAVGLGTPASAEDESPFIRLAKLGVYVPGWFLDPDIPARAGDGRPSTPIRDTVSYMLRVGFGKDGLAENCEVLMSNGPPALGEGFCRVSKEKMRIPPAPKTTAKMFWMHAYEDPETGDIRTEQGAAVEPKQLK